MKNKTVSCKIDYKAQYEELAKRHKQFVDDSVGATRLLEDALQQSKNRTTMAERHIKDQEKFIDCLNSRLKETFPFKVAFQVLVKQIANPEFEITEVQVRDVIPGVDSD